MKFKKVLMIDFNEKSLEPAYWKRIDEICEEKALISRDSPDISGHLPDTDCLLVNFLPVVDKAMIDAAPNLKYIGILATGYGRIDADYAATKDIPVCNIPGYSTEGVAEFAFAVILEYIRELERGKKQARERDYSEASFKGTELKDKLFGVVGLGSIGGRIAEIASRGFKADVRYWSKNRKEEYERKGIAYQELELLLKECDFISLNLALTKETEGIITRERIESIKPGAVVVNLAPMELVDMDALEKRLSTGDITFILDHSDELSEQGLKQLSPHENCVIYPPIAYTTKEATKNKQEIFVGNLENFLKGSPANVVN